MKSGDRIPALFFLALSVFICQQSAVIEVGSLGQPGPGLLPFGAGLAMGGLAIWFLIQSFVSKESRSDVSQDGSTFKRGRFFMVCVSLFVYTSAVNRLGFFLTTFLFVVFVLWLVESKKGWRTLLEAILITVGNYLLFVKWLGLGLPAGIFAW